MKRNQTITSAEYLSLLYTNDKIVLDNTLIVEGFVTIDGNKMIQNRSIEIKGLTFVESVLIARCDIAEPWINISNCYFMGGLTIEQSEGKWISIDTVTAAHITMRSCEFKSVSLKKVKISQCLDIAGLSLKDGLKLYDVDLNSIQLVDRSSGSIASIPNVITDHEIAALQFQMAGVRVYMSTEAVREMARKLGIKQSNVVRPV